MSRFETWVKEVMAMNGDATTKHGLMCDAIFLARKHGLDKPLEWRPWLVGEDMGIKENDMLLLNASWSLWPVVAMVCESETGLWVCDPESGVEFECDGDSFTWMPTPTQEEQ